MQEGQTQISEVYVRRLRQWSLAMFLKAYPLVSSISEGLTFCYQMLYLVDRSSYYSPILHLLGQKIVRVSGHELVQPSQLHLSCILPLHSAEPIRSASGSSRIDLSAFSYTL